MKTKRDPYPHLEGHFTQQGTVFFVWQPSANREQGRGRILISIIIPLKVNKYTNYKNKNSIVDS